MPLDDGLRRPQLGSPVPFQVAETLVYGLRVDELVWIGVGRQHRDHLHGLVIGVVHVVDLSRLDVDEVARRAEIHALRKRASNAIAEVLKSGILEKAFAYFQQNAEADNEDVLYQHIEVFRALLYCVRESGVDIPGKYRRLIAERKKTALFSRSMAQTGCQFVVDSPILFGQETSNEMLAFFRERRVADRKRIDETAEKDISALLASSMGKLGGIQAIVRKEAENLGKGLRIVILTNYIKKNLTTLIGTEDPLVEMGTVPIFEALRRDKIPGARLGVLSGTLAILPEAAVAALSRLALAEECSVSAKTIRDAGFSRIEFFWAQGLANPTDRPRRFPEDPHIHPALVG